jgi:hypothetical protein
VDNIARLVEANLAAVLAEISEQPEIGNQFPPELQSYSKLMDQIREYIVDAGEYALAYEVLVSTLEAFPFRLSGPTAIKLLEIGLSMKYKTERKEDRQFDFRRREGLDTQG